MNSITRGIVSYLNERGEEIVDKRGKMTIIKEGKSSTYFGKETYLSLLFGLVILIIIQNLSFSIAAVISSSNASNFSENEANLCLNKSIEIKSQMTTEGFNVLRVNDTIKEAQAYFNSQLILKEKKKSYSFSKVEEYCKSIEEIHKNALDARDSFNALILFYNTSVVPGMNTSTIDGLITEIKDGIRNERYEETLGLIDKTYDEISNVKAAYTALNAILQNTTRGLKSFFLKNWKTIIISLIVVIVLLIIYRIKIMRWILSRRIEKLKIRKKTIKELIMQIQADYFQYGKIAEGEYNIKTKKFAELIRDIDRQMPLLQEQLIKLGTKSWNLKE
jgi:hypothetical protein